MAENEAWAGKSRGNSLGYKIFLGLLKAGGLRTAYKLLPFVTSYYRLFVPTAILPLRQLYLKMGFDTRTTAQLIRKNLVIFGKTLLDKIAILSGLETKLNFEHEGGDYLSQLVAEGKGAILVSAHLGNWEGAGHMLKRLSTKINIVMYDGEGGDVKKLMAKYEDQRSFNLILIQDDLTHIYEISAALRRNEFVCLHADRFRPGNRTIVKPFLGEDANFPAGPFILASKLRAPVSFVFAMKEDDVNYKYFATEGKVYEGKGMTGAEAMATDYVAGLEAMLRKYPAQWFNYFDFWAARP